VKGGGHATNPGFSSTTGVLVALSRFNDIKVDIVSEKVEIGAGLTWDQVYANLESTGVNVVGARVPTVGVSGFTLGGGRCLPSSERRISYGLRLCIYDKSVRTCDGQRRWIRTRTS
jgi:FAD/FMN-containing dehydrogenase